MLPLVAVVAVMLAANVATNRAPARWYVPLSVCGAALLLLIGVLDGLTATDLGLGADTLLPGLVLALVLVLATAAVYLVAAAIPKARGLFADERATSASGREIAYRTAVAVPLGTVLLEETAFRSVLFGMVAVRHGGGWAVTVTAVLFGLWHVLPAIPMYRSNAAVGARMGEGLRGLVGTVVLTVLGTAAAGVGFALLRLWSGSVLPPGGLHWATNSIGLLAAWLLARRPAGAGRS